MKLSELLCVIRDFGRLEEFDPGTSTYGIEGGGVGKHRINLIKLESWVEQVLAGFGEGSNDFDE